MRKKLRQLAALLFAFVVGAGSIVYADTDAAPAEEAQKASVLEKLPEEGEKVCGFTVTEISDYLPKQAKVVSMEHEKSGAKLLWIACDDPDKAFNVYYRTDAADSKGLPHVFEHITLSGSGKYPSPNLWDEMSEGLYQTYMNAQTYQHMTGYKMSSLSEDQLLLIMDFYMDGLTDPLALRDEHPLMREAYRFELESPEDEISVTGAVFNEMESVNAAPASALYSTVQRLLYPGSSMSFNTGGVRDDIITISIDELKRFYTAFYHPSNMLILMYGDMDYTRFLEALDRDYLSRYEKKDIRITDDGYIPWTGSTEALVSLPVSKDASSETGGMTAYALSLGDIGDYDLALMSGVVSLLGSDDSPLTIRMEKDFPGASFSCELVNDTREPYVIFTLLDAENGTREAFRDAVRETVLEMAEQGFSPERTEALVNRVKMAGLLEAEQYGGLGLCEAAALSWARHGEPLSFLDAVAANLNLEEEAEKGSFDRLLAEYLTEPVRSVLVRMEPEPGLREARDNAFRQKLLDLFRKPLST